MVQFLLGCFGAAVIQLMNLRAKIVFEQQSESIRFSSKLFWFYYGMMCLVGGVLAVLLDVTVSGSAHLGAFGTGLGYEPILATLSLLAGKDVRRRLSTLKDMSQLDSDEPEDKEKEGMWADLGLGDGPDGRKTYRLGLGEYLVLPGLWER